MLLDTFHPILNLWSVILQLYQKWSNNYHLMDDNSFPKGSVISCSLTLNCTGISQRGKCLHQDIVSHKISLVMVAFSNEQDIFTPPPETLRCWMHFGRLSSVHRGHGTGLKLEGLFIFYVLSYVVPGCEQKFLTFTNDPQEETLPTKTGFVAEPFQQSTSFQLMYSSQREYLFKHWIVF